MTVDPSIIAALQSVVDGAPENVALRLHLAALLLDCDENDAALIHCAAALEHQPDNIEALALAARAADGAGSADRAARYDRLRLALTGSSSEHQSTPESTPPRALHADGEPAAGYVDDWDQVLHDVLAAENANGPRLTLTDVGGMNDVKRRLNTSFLGPLRNPKLRRMYGKSLRGGLLLWGPPGCGKTFLARAVAGEMGARFVSVGLHEVLDMWMGKSEQNLHGLFETARRQAPCVIFLDEVDAVGHKRSNLARSAARSVVVQLLAELDGLDAPNEGLFVLAASNQPWDIDPALRRPGRLDRTVCVLPPDEPARHAILALQLQGRPLGPVDLADVARRTDGYSGADLRLLCETAAERALEASIDTGEPRPISQDDLQAAVAASGPSTRPWFDMARNYAMFANPSGEFDELLAYIRHHRL